YQPLASDKNSHIAQLHSPLLHLCEQGWEARHHRYARWEAAMIEHEAYPADPRVRRQVLKEIFRNLPRRDAFIFAYAYFLRGGFLDGKAGLSFARAKAGYYRRIDKHRRAAQ